ncbi:Oidioi.mRNA.OKI2018_I69.chr1.g1719.t2.cds [Oikopleura dioica]|nr:Oidioi.mRNA.OKI2018_I69.chr1.g1719.t2.cds [Oikopleura dioica]
MVAQQKEKEEKERIRREEEERKRLEEQRRREEEERKRREEEERIRAEEEARKKLEMEKQQEKERAAEADRQKIIAGLNAQTAAQFSQYAAQQHPGDREAQKALIEHLQTQHYEQYMAQLSISDCDKPVPAPVQVPLPSNEVRIEPPSLWTRPQIRELKDQLRKDTESVLTVGRGEVVTVRVPTHEEGAYLFWEFATDSYDLGFGVYFEWSDVTTHQVSIAVNESSDEEYYPDSEEDEEGATHHGDAENGHRRSNRPPTDEIVPVYRRDCHQQVHAGSHQYPGSGVYLLKFDNSYSLWRSKTLYYRVYYTR